MTIKKKRRGRPMGQQSVQEKMFNPRNEHGHGSLITQFLRHKRFESDLALSSCQSYYSRLHEFARFLKEERKKGKERGGKEEEEGGKGEGGERRGKGERGKKKRKTRRKACSYPQIADFLCPG